MTAVAMVALALALPAQPHAHPRLSLVARSPVTVRGAGFQPHERVRVVLTATGRRTRRRLRASRAGAFRVTLGSVPGPCARFYVRARGNHGSRATLSGMRQPDCDLR